MNNAKSSTVAGILGIFLGSVGAHDFYLGGTHTKKGIIHVCLFGSGIVVKILASAILPNVLSWSALITMAWVLSLLGYIAAGCMSASGIWGLIDGICILSKGDAGLAAEGYTIQQPQYNQPQQQYGGAPQYGQPMQRPQQQPIQQPQQPMQDQSTGNPNEPVSPAKMG